MLVLLKFMYNCAIRWEILPANGNPCVGVDPLDDNGARERYLSATEVQRLFEEAKKSLPADAIVIYEIPLLAESNSRSRFDYAITVESDEPTRTSRLKERGLASHEIVGRMAAQASREDRISHCDIVIENHGTEDDLLRQVEEIWQSVLLPLAKNHGK
jgi:dephospho-CoA kinase